MTGPSVRRRRRAKPGGSLEIPEHRRQLASAAILRVLFGPALPRLSGGLMLEGGVDLAAHPIDSRASIIHPMAGG
jgi:hypothetical protein